MGWLIDTSLWVDRERGALFAADIHAITQQGPIYLSPVNLAEIRFGLELLKPGPPKQRAMALTSNAKDFADIPGLRMVVLKKRSSR